MAAWDILTTFMVVKEMDLQNPGMWRSRFTAQVSDAAWGKSREEIMSAGKLTQLSAGQLGLASLVEPF